MAELDLSFIDAIQANDLALQALKSRFNPVDVEDIQDFVDKVLRSLGPGDCIKTLTLYGHGRPGMVNVGSGRHERPSGLKLLSPRNAHIWRRQLRRLRCKFCPPEGRFRLNACGAGAEMDGARLLRMIAQELVCATVSAPLGTVSWVTEEGLQAVECQEVQGNWPPEIVPLPDPKPSQLNDDGSSKGWAASDVNRQLLIGSDWKRALFVAPRNIVAAKVYPAEFPRPDASANVIDKPSVAVPSPLVGSIRTSFKRPSVSWRAWDLLSIQGYLQLGLASAGKKIAWGLPGSLLGGCHYYCPFIYNSTFVYSLTERTASGLRRLIEGYYRGERHAALMMQL